MNLPTLPTTSVFYRRVLSQFPQDISLAFAYGSAVFRQSGTTQGQMGNNMLDFVLAVDDPHTWHTLNLKQNRQHYSFVRFMGPSLISRIQNSHGAEVYYNTLVPYDGRVINFPDTHTHFKRTHLSYRNGKSKTFLPDSNIQKWEMKPVVQGVQMIKYGVISTAALIEDLLHWKTLYVAGRLHKPVKILIQNENTKLQAALVSNLKSAVTAAFLMLPESFSEEDLFVQITGLSYSGDFRMLIGEDKSKVLNIVKAGMPHFQKLYGSILQECPQVVYKQAQGRLEVDKSPEGQFTQLMALPRTLQQKITELVDPPGKNRDVEDILLQVAQDPDCGMVVQQGVSAIVRSSSLIQSAKGILTAGVIKSTVYSLKKLQKMWKGLLRKQNTFDA